MHTELFLAKRYYCSKRKHPFVSLIGFISVTAISIGVAALIIVLAVMSGFEKELINKVVGTYAHMVIEGQEPYKPDSILSDGSLLSSYPSAPAIEAQALIKSKEAARGVLVKGVEWHKEVEVTDAGDYLQYGKAPFDDANEMVIGEVLARMLGVRIGSTVRFYATSHKSLEFKVIGLYRSGMYEYDSNLVYLSLPTAQRLYGLTDRVTGVSFKFESPMQALKMRNQIQEEVGHYHFVRTWQDMNRSLFQALKLEKAVMFIILTLIVLVASFNLVGMLTLSVIDKSKDIAILRSCGARKSQIAQVFMWMGIATGLIGACVGFGLGSGICVLLDKYPIISIPNDIYYFDKLPILFKWEDAVLVAGATFILTLIATILPSRAAASLHLAEALRYE